MQIYKRKWYTFGIIDYIYYFKHEGYVVFIKGGTSKKLLECSSDEFTHCADSIAIMKALNAYKKNMDENTYVTYGDID